VRTKKTILCIDDNEQSLSIRKFMLETRGYTVVACHNSREAVELFKKNPVDLILSDLMMPEVDGAELIRKLKTISPSTPAILFSGKVKIYENEMHADLFLPKGMYAPTELLERIRLLLVRKRGPKKAVDRVLPAETAAS
jgi:two-component system, OmpR family, response regulator CpxR